MGKLSKLTTLVHPIVSSLALKWKLSQNSLIVSLTIALNWDEMLTITKCFSIYKEHYSPTTLFQFGFNLPNCKTWQCQLSHANVVKANCLFNNCMLEA